MKRHLQCWRGLAPCVATLSFALTVAAQETKPPKIDHILLEVTDLKNSIAFYHDFLGLEIKSQSKDFVMLQSGNVEIFLSSGHWDWDEKRATGLGNLSALRGCRCGNNCRTSA